MLELLMLTMLLTSPEPRPLPHPSTIKLVQEREARNKRDAEKVSAFKPEPAKASAYTDEDLAKLDASLKAQ